MIRVTTKELSKNRNMVLSIINCDGVLEGIGYYNCDTRSSSTLKEGAVYSDEALFRILKIISDRENRPLGNANIFRWHSD